VRLTPILVTLLSAAAASTVASAQDDRLPVIRPQVEVVKASPAPFPFADKTPADFDTWIRTPWIQMNRAKCDRDCMEIVIETVSGLRQVDSAGAKKGPAKMRLGVVIPATCGEAAWYGEMRDQTAIGAGTKDPSENPIDQSRIHVFRFDEKGREVSMVFQNTHPGLLRQARLNVLCKTKL
jgi:hypothetical protein